MKKEYRGSWAGMTSVKISKFLGCSVSTTKKLLYSLEKQLGSRSAVDERVIAKLILELELKRYEKEITKYLPR